MKAAVRPKLPVDRAELERSSWAVEFKADSPVSYPTAIRYALDPALRVELFHTNETGDWQWVIAAVSHDPDFWMDAKPTKAEATALCRTMGWKMLR